MHDDVVVYSVAFLSSYHQKATKSLLTSAVTFVPGKGRDIPGALPGKELCEPAWCSARESCVVEIASVDCVSMLRVVTDV